MFRINFDQLSPHQDKHRSGSCVISLLKLYHLLMICHSYLVRNWCCYQSWGIKLFRRSLMCSVILNFQKHFFSYLNMNFALQEYLEMPKLCWKLFEVDCAHCRSKLTCFFNSFQSWELIIWLQTFFLKQPTTNRLDWMYTRRLQNRAMLSLSRQVYDLGCSDRVWYLFHYFDFYILIWNY